MIYSGDKLRVRQENIYRYIYSKEGLTAFPTAHVYRVSIYLDALLRS